MPLYMPSSILASGLLPSLQMPRRLFWYCSIVILRSLRIASLCASVLSIMALKASTWTTSAEENVEGFCGY